MVNIAKGQSRPKQEKINKKQFETLCAIQCTEEEICGVFEVSHDTLVRWCKRIYKKTFEEIYKKKKEAGKASVRRSQFMLAQKNATMSIWWGKQYLGQKENADNNNLVMQPIIIDDIGVKRG